MMHSFASHVVSESFVSKKSESHQTSSCTLWFSCLLLRRYQCTLRLWCMVSRPCNGRVRRHYWAPYGTFMARKQRTARKNRGQNVSLRETMFTFDAQSYLAVFPTLKQGGIAKVFKIKGASPWAITRAEKIQVSLFLLNKQSMDDWYTAVMLCPPCWSDVSMMGMNNMRKVVGYDFHYTRKKYREPGMWGTVRPQWPLLKQHLGGDKAGMVLGGEAWGETLYQQVQSTWGWYEGWSQNWWQLACLENLVDVSFGFVSLVSHWSFLVKKESSRAYMTRSGKKSMLSRYSFLEVNKMYHLAEWKRGSK